MRIPCNGIHVGLDSPQGDIPFLSHAHSDHTNGLKSAKKLISSEATRDLADIDAEVISVRGTKMIEAGHILGAKQLVVENDGEKTVYTGDFCVKPNVFGMKADVVQCDRLVMEATYGDPAYSFPDPAQIHSEIERWVKGNDGANLIIGCYELGKSQELIRMLNGSGVVPVVTEKTERFTSLYGKHGIKLERVMVGTDAAEEAMSRRFVALVPMGKAKRYFAHRLAEAFGRKTLCAVATGWALHYRFNTDAAFSLSDHADFSDLVWYIEQSGAKKVEFFCGDGSAVRKALKNSILNC
jgi:Cft2 family RNA processing exonuclease